MYFAKTIVALFVLSSSFLLPPVVANNDPHNSADDGDACGCNECTDEVLNRMAGGYTCGERIDYLMGGPHHLNEKEACIRVARTEFASLCGPECDPGRCDGNRLPGEEIPSTFCGCKYCDHRVWQTETTDSYTCGARITYLTDFDGLSNSDACNIVGGHEFPDDALCGKCDPARCEPAHGTDIKDYHCDCSRCTEAVWNLDADGSTCGDRIDSLVHNHPEDYPTEIDACRQVARVEFPQRCGTNCDPDLCDSPLTSRTSLYCFPEFDKRKRFRNVWGTNTVEVKESKHEANGVCGPHNNKFTTNTVERVKTNQLKLQFKKVGDKWEGSEVRLRMPEADMPFRYGTYSFSVKSIQVIDSNTGEITSTILPPSLVLGMQTWDATENYAIHENFNHQVGIEISRFDQVGPDSRFVVQPAIDFNTYSFYSGIHNSYKQAPWVYSFDWRSAKIEFYSNSGEAGETFTYSTERAIHAGQPDFTQCLPADAEVRINLWNLYGSLPPTDMAQSGHHIVEVVIDDFSYSPSDLEHVQDGGVCSKDCHCSPSSKCFGYICTPVGSHYPTIDSWLAAYNTGSNSPQGTSLHMIVGLSVFGCCVLALVLIAYQRIRNGRQMTNDSSIDDFNMSPNAVKG